jgi:hypothetical protein
VPERLPSSEQTRKALEQARKQPLTSPALGTAASDLVEPCAVSDPRPTVPRPAAGLPLALAFSGGGFRASLAALGVLRFLADAGLLDRVRYVSSVSGGSVAHGLFAHHYDELEQTQFEQGVDAGLKASATVFAFVVRSQSQAAVRCGFPKPDPELDFAVCMQIRQRAGGGAGRRSVFTASRKGALLLRCFYAPSPR